MYPLPKTFWTFFLIQNSFLSALIMVVPSSSVNTERLKYRHVQMDTRVNIDVLTYVLKKMTFIVSVNQTK